MHYYEYWGLTKPPFDNVPDPSMYVSSHSSSENAIAETVFAIEEGNDCIAVIVGDVGLGKTMSLRMVIDSLDPNRYQIAFVLNPDISFTQLMREIIGQLTGEHCEIKNKVTLLEVFNTIVFKAAEQGKKVVIVIDEANAISPANLESLRLLTNLQTDDANLFTLVMAGQKEFGRRLADPRRANLFQRVGTYCTMEKIESREVVKDYVQTRLSLAGGTNGIFTDDAIDRLWEYSEHGVPRLINKLCKLSLKAGETNAFTQIDGATVVQIGERFQRLTTQTASRKKAPAFREESAAEAPPETEEPFASESCFEAAEGAGEETFESAAEAIEEAASVLPPPVLEERKILQFAERPRQEEPALAPHPMEAVDATPDPVVEQEPPEPIAEIEAGPPRTEEEVEVPQYGVTVVVPMEIVDQLHAAPRDRRTMLAGMLAAQTMQNHPQLTARWGVDPLAVWNDIREVVLTWLQQDLEATVT
jgi:type II secretory pathway predicted ATPase ExeA